MRTRPPHPPKAVGRGLPWQPQEMRLGGNPNHDIIPVLAVANPDGSGPHSGRAAAAAESGDDGGGNPARRWRGRPARTAEAGCLRCRRVAAVWQARCVCPPVDKQRHSRFAQPLCAGRRRRRREHSVDHPTVEHDVPPNERVRQEAHSGYLWRVPVPVNSGHVQDRSRASCMSQIADGRNPGKDHPHPLGRFRFILVVVKAD
mmetsp:Transcript_15964/g.41301  ORF Transcript_15964/g.41301 Transcript_15964/m.41301 type:complete len:202 (-) Transcript_15964:239-844(-)